MAGPQERDEKSGSVGCFILGVIGVMLPVLYVLSIGPVGWVVTRNPSLQWIGVIYFPLGLLAESWTPFRNALNWYVELWL